jgi:hypothetical protein
VFKRFFQSHHTIQIEFPALAEYVQYLKARDAAEADTLRARVVSVNARLKQSAAALKAVADAAVQQQ